MPIADVFFDYDMSAIGDDARPILQKSPRLSTPLPLAPTDRRLHRTQRFRPPKSEPIRALHPPHPRGTFRATTPDPQPHLYRQQGTRTRHRPRRRPGRLQVRTRDQAFLGHRYRCRGWNRTGELPPSALEESKLPRMVVARSSMRAATSRRNSSRSVGSRMRSARHDAFSITLAICRSTWSNKRVTSNSKPRTASKRPTRRRRR